MITVLCPANQFDISIAVFQDLDKRIAHDRTPRSSSYRKGFCTVYSGDSAQLIRRKALGVADKIVPSPSVPS
jgi:hypothetical protein